MPEATHVQPPFFAGGAAARSELYKGLVDFRALQRVYDYYSAFRKFVNNLTSDFSAISHSKSGFSFAFLRPFSQLVINFTILRQQFTKRKCFVKFACRVLCGGRARPAPPVLVRKKVKKHPPGRGGCSVNLLFSWM